MENSSHIPPSQQPGPAPVVQETPEAAYRRRRSELPYKTPFLAGFLSILPGLGHIYVGFFREGLMTASFVAIWIVLITLQIDALLPVAIVGLVFTVFYGIIDATRRCQLYNATLDNEGDPTAIRDLEIPGRRGSMFGGVVLIVVGLLVFLNIKFDVSMAWLEDWWPLGLIALGVWLVVKARAEKAAGVDQTHAGGGYDRS